jgi:hypothetical protein
MRIMQTPQFWIILHYIFLTWNLRHKESSLSKFFEKIYVHNSFHTNIQIIIKKIN